MFFNFLGPDNFSKMQRNVFRCQAEENQHISPLMDDLQDALDRCVLGFSGSFPMMVGRNNLPCHVTVSSTLLTSRCSGRKYRGPLKHGLTTSRQCKGLHFDAVSALVSPFAWVGGRCVHIAGVGKVLIKSWRKVSFENGVNNLRSVISLFMNQWLAVD